MRMKLDMHALNAIAEGLATMMRDGIARRSSLAVSGQWEELSAIHSCQELHARLITRAASSWITNKAVTVKLTPAQGAAVMYLTNHLRYGHLLGCAMDHDIYKGNVWDNFRQRIHQELIDN